MTHLVWILYVCILSSSPELKSSAVANGKFPHAPLAPLHWSQPSRSHSHPRGANSVRLLKSRETLNSNPRGLIKDTLQGGQGRPVQKLLWQIVHLQEEIPFMLRIFVPSKLSWTPYARSPYTGHIPVMYSKWQSMECSDLVKNGLHVWSCSAGDHVVRVAWTNAAASDGASAVAAPRQPRRSLNSSSV